MKEENEAKASELGNNKENESNGREEVYTKIIRAGNRTYFLDVKSTRKNDLYLTITESKKRFNRDGKFFYEKHKLFLYKEDFDKFADSLKEIIEFIREANPQPIDPEETETAVVVDSDKPSKETVDEEKDFTNVEFEDLGEESA